MLFMIRNQLFISPGNIGNIYIMCIRFQKDLQNSDIIKLINLKWKKSFHCVPINHNFEYFFFKITKIYIVIRSLHYCIIWDIIRRGNFHLWKIWKNWKYSSPTHSLSILCHDLVIWYNNNYICDRRPCYRKKYAQKNLFGTVK